MDPWEIRRIIKTKFPGYDEKLGYCTHCLNPLVITCQTVEEEEVAEELLGQGHRLMIPAIHQLAEMLHRAMPKVFRNPYGEEVKGPPHECPECSLWEGGQVRPGVIMEAIDQGERVACCPNCMLPMHRGEGPLSAEGYRAELLRRLFPGALEITPELFTGPTMGTQPQPPQPIPLPMAAKIDDWEIQARRMEQAGV